MDLYEASYSQKDMQIEGCRGCRIRYIAPACGDAINCPKDGLRRSGV